jgi:hypothetical protein
MLTSKQGSWLERISPAMKQLFAVTGGAQIGWVNASWPLARLSATSDRLAITVRILGSYSFTSEQVSAVERYAFIPFLAWGVRIRHRVPDYPRRIIFWCFNDPTTVLQGIRDAGFAPTGSEPADGRRAGLPVRWSAIIGAIAVWNLLVILPFLGQPGGRSLAGWRVLFPLYAVLVLFFAILKFGTIQDLLLKPDRSVGEIKPFLRLLAFICGVLAIIFSAIVLLNKGHFPSE